MNLVKVRQGEPILPSSGDYNAFIEAALAHRGRSADQRVSGEALDTKPGVLWVRNDTGADIDDLGRVLGLDGLVFTPDGEARTAVVFKGVTPDKAEHRGKFCVLSGPVRSGRIVEAYLDTIALVRLFVPLEEGTDKAAFAEIDDGETRLRAACYGSAQILYRELSYGEMWAVVRLGRAPATFPVKLTQVGGAQGTDTDPATWTYDVLDPCTEEVLSDSPVDPTATPHKWQRPSVGQMIEATYGMARFDSDGAVVLTWVNETPEQQACPT